MGTSRLPEKVFEYCRKVARKISKGESWNQDWKLLISSLYSPEGKNAIYAELGLPPTIPPYMFIPNDLDDLIAEIEEQLNSLGDDAQLANVDLQGKLQKQQQTVQMLSNVSKALHDSAMGVIRKIG